MSIEQRLAVLERSNRRLRAGLGAVLLLGLAVVMLGQTSFTPKPGESKEDFVKFYKERISGDRAINELLDEMGNGKSLVGVSIPAGGRALMVTPQGWGYLVDAQGHISEPLARELPASGNLPARSNMFDFHRGIVVSDSAIDAWNAEHPNAQYQFGGGK